MIRCVVRPAVFGLSQSATTAPEESFMTYLVPNMVFRLMMKREAILLDTATCLAIFLKGLNGIRGLSQEEVRS